MNPAVGRSPVPADVLAVLPGAQYSSAFTLRTTRTAAPEQWARALFEQCPAPWRALLWLGWRFGLGLRLGPRHSPDYVQGWSIVDSGAEQVTLAKQNLSSLGIPVTVSELAYGYQERGGAQDVLDAIDSINIHMLPFFAQTASTCMCSFTRMVHYMPPHIYLSEGGFTCSGWVVDLHTFVFIYIVRFLCLYSYRIY